MWDSRPATVITPYVSPASNLMEHWDFMLQDGHKGSFDWEYTTPAE